MNTNTCNRRAFSPAAGKNMLDVASLLPPPLSFRQTDKYPQLVRVQSGLRLIILE